MNESNDLRCFSEDYQIKVLTQRINEMQHYSDLGRADKTHYRDRIDKHRNLCLNALNEVVLVDLKLCLHAIDRPQPKMDVSIHRVELAIDAVMEVIRELTEDKL
jgi:hypothetical protein